MSAALIIRLCLLWDAGLVHYDEGIYSVVGLRIAEGEFAGMWERGELESIIAPPLYPLLVGLFLKIGAAADWMPGLVSALAGTAAVWGLFLMGQRFHSRRAGLLAAGLLAVCPYHVLYSRAGLTDSLFTALFIFAMYFLLHGIRNILDNKPFSWMAFIAGGVLTGGCLNTKYHGFLPVVLAGIYGLIVLIARKRKDPDTAWKPLLARISAGTALAGIIGFILFIPWLVYLSRHPGWGAFIEHRTAFGGDLSFKGLLTSLLTAGALLYKLNGPLILLMAAGIVITAFKPPRMRLEIYIWLVPFFLLIFYYRVYPRLLLPLMVPLCLLAGEQLDALLAMGRKRLCLGLSLAALLAGLGWCIPIYRVPPSPYREGARIAGQMSGQGPVILACQPCIRFYLLLEPKVRWDNVKGLNPDRADIPQLIRENSPALLIHDLSIPPSEKWNTPPFILGFIQELEGQLPFWVLANYIPPWDIEETRFKGVALLGTRRE